jgi:hypothetical protein
MPLDVLVEVDAERLGAQCQEDDADNDIHRFENVTHHRFGNLMSAQRFKSLTKSLG